jgi:FkbM family methyltransferase
LKDLVKAAIASVGYEVRRLKGPSNPSFHLLNALNHFGVDLVFDVGANTGQFSSTLLSLGYAGRLVSFEPSSNAHELLSRAATKYPNWRVHPRVAIGDTEGNVVLNVSANSVSSSLLPMLTSHSAVASGSEYVTSERVAVRTLDALAPPYLSDIRMPFLKIDTQGFEWQVLDGATRTLPLLCGVTCELSLVALYDGQRLWKELMSRLEEHNFQLWSLERGFTDKTCGRTLQIDATFFRTKKSFDR